ncbi:hypothetical protein [Roseobacter sp. EG26]|uniref:hypothetical protein n=1 Tax=Roseobacter sp. EG26 TaxID=3412477 RepID=UPI003CE448AC
MTYFGFTEWSVRSLIQKYDQDRLVYVFFWFPVYQIITILAVLSAVLLCGVAKSTAFEVPVVIGSGIALAALFLPSWHLSTLLLTVTFFDVLARIGLPGMFWIRNQVVEPVNWFRQKVGLPQE